MHGGLCLSSLRDSETISVSNFIFITEYRDQAISQHHEMERGYNFSRTELLYRECDVPSLLIAATTALLCDHRQDTASCL